MAGFKTIPAMFSALVAILMLWPSPGGANPQPAPNASMPDEPDIKETRGKVKRVWTSENYSRVLEEEYYIDAAPVRNFTVRPGYNKYETPLSPLSGTCTRGMSLT
ncbi:hypothetical protein [Pyrobaculum aerophilum]|nr:MULTISPECIES: hypothetical protein [Pyrobaculum]MCX8135953.1 hypothetical protein [Pyrobaculum aerophilum]HII46360.1 hypothetical protein [Pyrobaculum aerophilum]